MDVSPSPEWLTVEQAAAKLQCGVKVVYTAIKRGQLRAAKIGFGRSLRTSERWIAEYVEASAAPVEVRR